MSLNASFGLHWRHWRHYVVIKYLLRNVSKEMTTPVSEYIFFRIFNLRRLHYRVDAHLVCRIDCNYVLITCQKIKTKRTHGREIAKASVLSTVTKLDVLIARLSLFLIFASNGTIP